MSIQSVEGNWWAVPVDKLEKRWITVSLLWCIIITVMMPLWHFTANQTVSTESYKIPTEMFDQLVDKFIEKYQVGEEQGVAVVAPPAGADIFMRGVQFAWEPILKLKVNKTYRLHLSSVDVNHGFSITPLNTNFMAIPGWDFVLTVTPTTTGTFIVQCNEFCGAGHHEMVGKIIVE